MRIADNSRTAGKDEPVAFTPPAQINYPPLEPISVPEESMYWPALDAVLHTGASTVEDVLTSHYFNREPRVVAMDIETHGVKEGKWAVTCVTAAWFADDGTCHSVLLDPLRRDRDRQLCQQLAAHATTLVFHNAAFDAPILVNHQLIAYEDVNKIADTLLLSRMVNTGTTGRRSLSELSTRFGIAAESNVSIEVAMRAAGFANKNEGYDNADIDRDFYRKGAMSDTVATLRLYPLIYNEVMNEISGERHHNTVAVLSDQQAHFLIHKIATVQRVILRASCRGMALDRDHIRRWRENAARLTAPAIRLVEAAGLRPGVGADVVAFLDSRGAIPSDWPRTKGGALSSDKHAMERLSELGHPIAQAHSIIAETGKNDTYFSQMELSASGTGRVHFELDVLGAHASGRMSAKNPPVQQFSAEARPALISDGPDLWSVDWSSIEPVVLSNCAGDADFITPFNNGADLYIPVAKAAGLIPRELSDEEAKDHPGRKKAKVILLAQMYGQGIKSLAEANGWTEHEAQEMSSAIQKSMAPTFQFMRHIRGTCAATGRVRTILGRVLDESFMKNGRRELKDRIAVNHFCQGSAADMLMETTYLMEQMGYGDHIHLWVHDELVVDEEGLEATKKAMATVPDSLLGYMRSHNVTLDPVLRIDSQLMGRHWLKV